MKTRGKKKIRQVEGIVRHFRFETSFLDRSLSLQTFSFLGARISLKNLELEETRVLQIDPLLKQETLKALLSLFAVSKHERFYLKQLLENKYLTSERSKHLLEYYHSISENHS